MRSAALIAIAAFLPFQAQAACVEANGSDLVLRGELATDTGRALTWKRCAAGMKWNASANRCTGEPFAMSLSEAHAYAQSLGKGWRVPTGPEMESLLRNTCKGPKVDTTAFPDIAASDFGEGATFWTSTEAIPGMFYFFDLMAGYADMHSQGFQLSVLLVKEK